MVDWNNMSVTINSKPDVNDYVDENDYGNGVENALESVNRFSRERTLRRIDATDDPSLSLNEMMNLENYTDYRFWAVVHPRTDDSTKIELKNDVSGEYIKNRIRVHYNPAYKDNLTVDPFGVFLNVGGTEDYPNYSDLLLYDNQWWKVIGDKRFDVIDEDEDANNRQIRIAELSLLTQTEIMEHGYTSYHDRLDTSL